MLKKYLIASFVVLFFIGCKNGNKKNIPGDDPTKGTIFISVDESFKPVVEQQILVYKSSNPEANIVASYKPEVDCFKDLMNDSTRMIIVAKGLSKNEMDFYENNLSFKPQFAELAYDAVSAISSTVGKLSFTNSSFTITGV